MKFLGMGWIELVIILVIVLIIFGPKNLPKLGKAIGNGVKGLRKGMQSGKNKIDEKFDAVEEEKASNVNKAEDSGNDAELVVEEILNEDEPDEAIEVEEEVVEPETSAPSSESPKKTVKVKRVVKTTEEK